MATALDSLIDRALAEDVGAGDLTTEAIVPEEARGQAAVVVRERGIICGLEQAAEVIRRLDPDSSMRTLIGDGSRIEDSPAVAATIDASLRALLTGERLALNLLQRLSGIATVTAAYAEAISGTGAQLLDTRKTVPGMRALDKYAVACGGGTNHRSGLADAILIKDNHLLAAGSIAAAVGRVREAHPGLPVEVEVDTIEQLRQALAAGADTVLLDNMDVATLRRAVAETAGRARLEASGGITIDSIRDIAATGVDAVSVGALTHSVRALDIALEVIPSPS